MSKLKEGGDLPIYALVEVFSFGTLSKFYKNMKNEDKKTVAKSFGIGYTYFESWLESISYVRNIARIMDDCIMQNSPKLQFVTRNIYKSVSIISEYLEYFFA